MELKRMESSFPRQTLLAVVVSSSIVHAAALRHPAVTLLHVAGPLTMSLIVVVEVATIETEMMIVANGAVMSARMTVVMTVVTDAEMMAGGLTMAMAAALTALLLPMLTLIVRYVPSMVTPLASAGGATPMTRRTRMIMRRVPILPHMVLIQTGTLTQGQQITSLAS
jgi:hypothetical protein